MPLPRLLPFAAALLLVACAGREAAPDGDAPADDARPVADSAPGLDAMGPATLGYDLASPDATFQLPAELQEISGLGWTAGGHLVAVQDELGEVFSIDPTSGAVLERRRFRGGGDYEGVEWVDGMTWVLKSNGTLYAVPDAGGEGEEFDTGLGGRCDAEGLAHDAAQNRLLILCKEDPGPRLGDVRAVYAFDLGTHTIGAAPAFTMDRGALDSADENFKPSALAVHPTTGQLYVLSSVRKALAVVGMDGAVTSVTPLPAALYPQPEGIAFAPDGTLYISNEGDTGAGTLLRFTARRSGG
ncbi:MAG TPA: SdiA-regulated domain-containing protein [Rhodothermales bacterium]|nr:SdiA-regulated domain-containing protein [Rhodothermales bacterium]